jgi:hypothetical protein
MLSPYHLLFDSAAVLNVALAVELLASELLAFGFARRTPSVALDQAIYQEL